MAHPKLSRRRSFTPNRRILGAGDIQVRCANFLAIRARKPKTRWGSFWSTRERIPPRNAFLPCSGRVLCRGMTG